MQDLNNKTYVKDTGSMKGRYYGIETYKKQNLPIAAGKFLNPAKCKKQVGAGPQPCKVEANKSKQQATNQ
jgi:hypothetical protein